MINNREILDKRSKEGLLSRKTEENTKKQQSTLAEKQLPSIQTLLAAAQPSLLDDNAKLRAIAKTLLDNLDFNDDLFVSEILTFANSPSFTVKQNLLSKIQKMSENFCQKLGEKAASNSIYQLLNNIPALLLLNENNNNSLNHSQKRPLASANIITSVKKTKPANSIGTKESPIPLHLEEDKKNTEGLRTTIEDRQQRGVSAITSSEKIFGEVPHVSGHYSSPKITQPLSAKISAFDIQTLSASPSQTLLDMNSKKLTEIAKILDDTPNFYDKIFTQDILTFTQSPNLIRKENLIAAIRAKTRRLYKNGAGNDPIYRILISITPLLEKLCPNATEGNTFNHPIISSSFHKTFFSERAQQTAPSSMAPFATAFKPTPLDGFKQQLIQKSKMLTEHLDNILDQNSNDNILSSAEEKFVESIHDYIKQIATTELSSSFIAKGLIRRTHAYLRGIEKSPLSKFKPLKTVLNNIKTILLSFINFATQNLNLNNTNPAPKQRLSTQAAINIICNLT